MSSPSPAGPSGQPPAGSQRAETYREAQVELARQFAGLLARPGNPFERSPIAGHLRGIDHYRGANLIKVMTRTIGVYRNTFGEYPDLLAPRGFNEKLLWSKFFRNIKVPETGNKLLTASFIPEALRGDVRCPEIVWHSSTPGLPSNDALPAGDYYLKASHGSGMFEPIRYPLTADRRAALEALGRAWLGRVYGQIDGEWWYARFKPELLIEQSIVMNGPSISWGIWVFGDRIPHVTAISKLADESHYLWLDDNLRVLPFQREDKPRIAQLSVPRRFDEARRLALAIGRSMRFVRVDFLFDADGRPWLGEITLTPGGALTRRPAAFDRLLGDCWNLDGDG